MEAAAPLGMTGVLFRDVEDLREALAVKGWAWLHLLVVTDCSSEAVVVPVAAKPPEA